MYYRRWTRMFLQPAYKYLSRYGVIEDYLYQYAPLFQTENPIP